MAFERKKKEHWGLGTGDWVLGKENNPREDSHLTQSLIPNP